jgi:hypothetical protein
MRYVRMEAAAVHRQTHLSKPARYEVYNLALSVQLVHQLQRAGGQARDGGGGGVTVPLRQIALQVSLRRLDDVQTRRQCVLK